MPTDATSNESGFDTSPLTDQERVDVRRYTWYPAYGPGPSGFQSWRYFQSYGMLEYRLTNMAPGEFGVLRYMLGNLAMLEAALPAASGGLNVGVASVFTRNPRELLERKQLYDYHRRELCNFMGVPPGPYGCGSGGSIVI
jgi:hypothetical protein